MSVVDTAPKPTATAGEAFIKIRDLRHEYAGVTALNRTSLDIRAGEFVTLLGPSGSGKSTLLHILAGLIEPTEGVISIGGTDVTRTAPEKREIGLVFQNYALFPHLSARQNIEFPLRIRKAAASESDRRVNEVLDLVDLKALAERRPDQLSGGQQQRVAVGRAIASTPKVLLLDEPLGALDRRLRQQLGRQLRRVQRETGITTVFVTHDQEEAFTMSDRVVVMNHGEIRQIGTPEEVYATPRDAFVARFVGEVNLWTVDVEGRSEPCPWVMTATGARFRCQAGEGSAGYGEALSAVVRPERVWVWPADEAPPRTDLQHVDTGRVVESTFLGNSRSIIVESPLLATTSALLYDGDQPRFVGDRVAIGWRDKDALLVPHDGATVDATLPRAESGAAANPVAAQSY